MPAHNIVGGQKVTGAKLERARELRRCMTPEECLVWEHLRGHRLDGLHFRRQQVIDGFIVDFYCHALGLIVELDGGVHQRQASYDAERDRILARRGLRVLRIPNQHVTADIEAVLRRIAAAAREAPPHRPPNVGG